MSLNKWKVNEIDVLKSTQKGLPAPGSDASYAQGSSPFLLGYETQNAHDGRNARSSWAFVNLINSPFTLQFPQFDFDIRIVTMIH